ncbi:MAG: peptide chain release factor 1, partial [archaeon]|nr:peptide chain release factor 1 [archaeon]
NPLNFNINSIKCEECASTVEIIEEIDYLDYMLEKSQKIGAEMKVISRDTEEGEQFYKGFSGIGAILRFK